MIYHVSPNGSNSYQGTLNKPFRTINHAAGIAVAGDTVIVHDGVYREWVNPKNGGASNHNRIIYEAAPGEHPIIKGSEILTDWEHVENNVWKKTLPNSMFGEWNPYALTVEGDWKVEPSSYDVHLGCVYINGVAMYEASSMDDLYEAKTRYTCCKNIWSYFEEYVQFPELTVYRWYSEVDKETTTIYGNFKDKDPNAETIEINVRPCCFYPRLTGRNYITLRGFEIAHAACPWTPPTSDQIGMVGPHWSIGWIIENNDIHDAKCSAVSLGKEVSTGDNKHTKFDRKSGHRHQLEAVFLGLSAGWSKDKVGSHIVRNNVIHDCGQNAIVGHMGCAFSKIEHNHIYNIGLRREYFGHEMAGIKFHAGIDVTIENNYIHHCILGIWLDWQAQGARITRNVMCENSCDLEIEVSHGPTTVDNNLFLSRVSFMNFSQGTAMAHNLILGTLQDDSVLGRSTPYHLPHSTAVLGYSEIYGGDDRYYNNIFAGCYETDGKYLTQFAQVFDKYTDPDKYYELLSEKENLGLGKYNEIKQPVWLKDNVYSGKSEPAKLDKNPITADNITAEIFEGDNEVTLKLTVPKNMTDTECEPVTTERLGETRLSEESFENPDGTALDLTLDITGNTRERKVLPGPFASLSAGEQKFTVWKK